MSGVVLALAPCLRCGTIFGFNPNKVPSFRWPEPDGPKEPVCGDCMEAINKIRRGMGLAPFEILPGAYDGCPEEELA